MPLTDAYVQTPGQMAEFFQALCNGQAPPQFTQQYLKDLGFTSTNHRAFLPLLKSLGFLSADGAPTSRYHEYRDSSQSRRVLGEAVKEAYADLFLIRAQPSENDRPLIEGKFKSVHNVSDVVAKRMANTFFALLPLADLTSPPAPAVPAAPAPVPAGPVGNGNGLQAPTFGVQTPTPPPGLHYNIQIHLPATKDVEVFNAIFKSLREHLLA